ncbi:M48 family metallopeptidase [Massilia sp. YIM B02443]|uniref:tetratricopeptide repeat protein n=1 Tax=Massilia sp. YIM B02443 TaxID=3050127 RepID=UPI0025B7173D|nr:hypothetical protein [Massilia sp. YIM B02443]MDN4037678.1 hypothetical protein [Massilia sp. YIM B02443]
MRTTPSLRRLVGGALCALALSACSTVPTKSTVAAPPTLAELMSKAAAADGAGQKEAAITLWRQAATAFPADKEPWTRIAQTRFDAGQYGEAIVSAEEIKVRDPNDQLANSILAIGGLRLATRALADLRSQNNLSGSLRTESQDLAKLLRESLGQQDLVPPPPPAPRARAGNANPPRSTRRSARQNSESSADPFDALK